MTEALLLMRSASSQIKLKKVLLTIFTNLHPWHYQVINIHLS